jgi:hypothetical protein
MEPVLYWCVMPGYLAFLKIRLLRLRIVDCSMHRLQRKLHPDAPEFFAGTISMGE